MSFSMGSNKGMNEETQQLLAEFLTQTDKPGQPDINSRIESSKTALALALLRMLENDGVAPAGFAADEIEKLSWSLRGMSRTEVVRSLMRVPGGPIRQEEVNRGIDSSE